MKYVFTDLDGTLLTKDGLTQEAIDHCLAYQQRGNRLILASGRNEKSVEGFVESLQLERYKGALILVNGEVYIDYDIHERIEVKPLTKKEAIKLVRLADLMLFRIYIVTKEGRYTYSLLYESLFYFARLIIKHKPIPKLTRIRLKDLPEEVQKIELSPTFFFKYFVRIYSKLIDSKYEVVSVGPYWVEVLPKGVSKANMVNYYLNKHQIQRDDVYIFGDGENDIGMLKLTDHSYTPENGAKLVKQYAKRVIGNSNDLSVSKEIERIGKEG